jgi:predicted metal-dependent phosphoesterase TrpH
MLKAEFHAHCSLDPRDVEVRMSPEQLIDRAARQGYAVLAITLHDGYAYSKKLASYAKKKGVLLIPALERTIKGCHVLLYNFSLAEARKIHSFEDLRKIKKPRHMVIAPHPYHPLVASLRAEFEGNIDLFDAVEWSNAYASWINPNKKSAAMAKKHRLPMVATSDAHFLWQLCSQNYTMVDSKPAVSAVIAAVKAGRVSIVTRPLSLWRLFLVLCSFVYSQVLELSGFWRKPYIPI